MQSRRPGLRGQGRGGREPRRSRRGAAAGWAGALVGALALRSAIGDGWDAPARGGCAGCFAASHPGIEGAAPALRRGERGAGAIDLAAARALGLLFDAEALEAFLARGAIDDLVALRAIPLGLGVAGTTRAA